MKQFTGEEPMLSLVHHAEEVIQRPKMVSASVAEGYPYADVAEMGMAFLAISDGDEAAARDAARWMARRAWDKRAQFVADTPAPEAALRPVILPSAGPPPESARTPNPSRPSRQSAKSRAPRAAPGPAPD